jgi:hypothetical protein
VKKYVAELVGTGLFSSPAASAARSDAGQKSCCGKLAIYDADSQATARLVVGSDSTPSFPASSSMQTRGNAQRHGLPNYPCESAALSA